MSAIRRLTIWPAVGISLFAFLAACGGCGGSAAAAASSSKQLSLPLSHQGQFILDARGRALFFHGVNMVNKFPPYAPSALGFDVDDARILADAGSNLVRLGVIYSAVEPTPGTYNDAYLDSIAGTVKLLRRHGIMSLLDFHQDIFGPTFTGEGFPDWAAQTDDLPTLPNLGWPDDYFQMDALQHAFDHFWEDSAGPDRVGLQEHYIAAWLHVAERFKSDRAVLGYDLFNEPFPGTDWQPCATANGCSAFDEGALGEFYAKLVPALEAADSNHIVFYEPLIFFDGGAETHVPSPSGPRVGMSFHDYEPANFKRPLDNALNQSKSTGDALLMTEFGASVDAAPVVEVANLADTFMMSWLYWTYANGTPYLIASSSGFPPPQQQGVVINLALPRTGTNVNQAVLTAISRPYPQTIAGTPQSFSFDPKSGKFQLAYSTAGLGPSLKSSETDILVPLTQYPNGYTATVAGGRVVSSPNSRLLRIAAKSNSGGTVSVQVVPK